MDIDKKDKENKLHTEIAVLIRYNEKKNIGSKKILYSLQRLGTVHLCSIGWLFPMGYYTGNALGEMFIFLSLLSY